MPIVAALTTPLAAITRSTVLRWVIVAILIGIVTGLAHWFVTSRR